VLLVLMPLLATKQAQPIAVTSPPTGSWHRASSWRSSSSSRRPRRSTQRRQHPV